MRIDDYQKYLIMNGKFDEFAGKEIQMLLKTELDLGIDFDDYIPYGGDYDKVSELNELMPEEMRYNERVQFAINRYMRFALDEETGKL